MTHLKVKLLAVFTFFLINAQAQTAAYRYQMPIKGVTSNWHSFELPNVVFEKAQSGLEDLRIYGFKGKDTIEVPYILEKSANQLIEKESNFTVINQSKNQEGFYFTFQSNLITIINTIKLSFKQINFDWKVTLEGSNNNTDWFTILNDYRILAIQNNNTSYRFTQLNFPDSKYAYYRIMVKAAEQPQLNAVKISKIDTLKGIEKEIRLQSYQVSNDPKNKESTILLALANVAPISYLKLNAISNFDFYRPLKIEYATDTNKGSKHHYENLYEGVISSLEKPEFNFESKLTRYLKVTIQNDDNKPLHFNSIIVKGPIYELIARFEKPNYQYALYYGNKTANAPIYELKNFANKIPISITSLGLGAAKINPAYIEKGQKPLFENKAWLWAVMGIAISLLGFFAYKMLREK